MNERRRPPRRGRGQRPFGRPPAESFGEPNPYRDSVDTEGGTTDNDAPERSDGAPPAGSSGAEGDVAAPAGRTEAPRPEVARPEVPRPEAPRPDSSRPEGPRDDI